MVNASSNTGTSSDGVYINAGNNVLSNVTVSGNGRNGLFLDSSAGADTITGIQAYQNVTNGVFWGSGANNTQVINLQTFGNANGVEFGGNAQQIILTGSLNQDTATEVAFGSSVTKSVIDLVVNPVGGGGTWSGTIAGNTVRIVSTGPTRSP
jgi:hypothetical protein